MIFEICQKCCIKNGTNYMFPHDNSQPFRSSFIIYSMPASCCPIMCKLLILEWYSLYVIDFHIEKLE